MHTPAADTPFSAQAPAHESSLAETQTAAPAVIVAGSRVSRELVRLFVASAFFILEAVLRLDELRFSKRLRRRRRA